ncbi:MAG: hypothetical protein ACRC67_18195 [Inquilinus sp.]|uniref:hypothetical protein n=1 Tax=Inquilinus sp. TaxID=1932117 RepID=UPI003F3880B5
MSWDFVVLNRGGRSQGAVATVAISKNKGKWRMVPRISGEISSRAGLSKGSRVALAFGHPGSAEAGQVLVIAAADGAWRLRQLTGKARMLGVATVTLPPGATPADRAAQPCDASVIDIPGRGEGIAIVLPPALFGPVEAVLPQPADDREAVIALARLPNGRLDIDMPRPAAAIVALPPAITARAPKRSADTRRPRSEPKAKQTQGMTFPGKLTEQERGHLERIIAKSEPTESFALAAIAAWTGLARMGPAAILARRLTDKGYLVARLPVAGKNHWAVRRLDDGTNVKLPPEGGARVEVRDGLPIPVTICPTRHAAGSVSSVEHGGLI